MERSLSLFHTPQSFPPVPEVSVYSDVSSTFPLSLTAPVYSAASPLHTTVDPTSKREDSLSSHVGSGDDASPRGRFWCAWTDRIRTNYQ
ncbi:hypothetical protein DPMN_154827 [Dreissena polymorpha]|uniref:Uncharacterized protein n=1 Tax=Dreissena polymorpha TaxID=45954 RepID=A0A9D4FRK4_DREPO|nr:hypothetical protein DPMN_154827 [Dreissena polymorpha]